MICRKGSKDKELSEWCDTLVVDSSKVSALVEIKSYADSSALEYFENLLSACDLSQKGYFVGITGSIKGLQEGIDVDSKPKKFVFAKPVGGNVKAHTLVDTSKIEERAYKGVLRRFLETLKKDLS